MRVTAELKTILKLEGDGYVAFQGADVVLYAGVGLVLVLTGPVLEAVLKACLEAKGVQLGEYTIREVQADSVKGSGA